MLDSIDKLIDDIRERRAANEQILAEDAPGEEADDATDKTAARNGPSIRSV